MRWPEGSTRQRLIIWDFALEAQLQRLSTLHDLPSSQRACRGLPLTRDALFVGAPALKQPGGGLMGPWQAEGHP